MQSRTFLSNGFRLRYLDAGTGAPIVFLHGFGHDATRWVKNGAVRRFASQYRVLALDCRGHGESDKPHEPSGYLDMDHDVIALLDAIGVERAHVVGYSMGGALVGRLIVTERRRLLTATLVGSTGLASNARAVERARMADDFERGDARALVLAVRPTNEPPPDADQLREASARVLAGNDPLALAALLRAPIAVITPHDLAAAAVTLPILGVAGTADPALASLMSLAEAVPTLRVVAINGAGHASTLARPELLDALDAFIAAPRPAP